MACAMVEMDKFQSAMRPMNEAPFGANGHSIMGCIKLESGSQCWVPIQWDNYRSDRQLSSWRRANANGTLGAVVRPIGWLPEEEYYQIKAQ
jgi:hypothetical protein